MKRQVQVPDTYCKSCRIKISTEARRTRRLIDALPAGQRAAVEIHRQGPCEVCGRRMRPQSRVLLPNDVPACLLCAELLETCGQDLAVAKATWLEIHNHMADERRLDRIKEQRCPGVRRRFHAENPDAPAIPHVQCITLERHWAAVIRFLSRQRAEALTPAP